MKWNFFSFLRLGKSLKGDKFFGSIVLAPKIQQVTLKTKV